MGASVFSLWKMLSKDFVALVIISLAIVNTGLILLYAPMVAELSVSNRNILVGFCPCRYFRDRYNNRYSQFPKYKSGIGKSGEELEGGVRRNAGGRRLEAGRKRLEAI